MRLIGLLFSARSTRRKAQRQRGPRQAPRVQTHHPEVLRKRRPEGIEKGAKTRGGGKGASNTPKDAVDRGRVVFETGGGDEEVWMQTWETPLIITPQDTRDGVGGARFLRCASFKVMVHLSEKARETYAHVSTPRRRLWLTRWTKTICKKSLNPMLVRKKLTVGVGGPLWGVGHPTNTLLLRNSYEKKVDHGGVVVVHTCG